jgi:hypothetical protein
LLESRGHIDRDDARSTSSGVAWGCGRHVEDDDVDDDIGDDDDDDDEEEEARCQRW